MAHGRRSLRRHCGPYLRRRDAGRLGHTGGDRHRLRRRRQEGPPVRRLSQRDVWQHEVDGQLDELRVYTSALSTRLCTRLGTASRDDTANAAAANLPSTRRHRRSRARRSSDRRVLLDGRLHRDPHPLRLQWQSTPLPLPASERGPRSHRRGCRAPAHLSGDRDGSRWLDDATSAAVTATDPVAPPSAVLKPVRRSAPAGAPIELDARTAPCTAPPPASYRFTFSDGATATCLGGHGFLSAVFDAALAGKAPWSCVPREERRPRSLDGLHGRAQDVGRQDGGRTFAAGELCVLGDTEEQPTRPDLRWRPAPHVSRPVAGVRRLRRGRGLPRGHPRHPAPRRPTARRCRGASWVRRRFVRGTGGRPDGRRLLHGVRRGEGQRPGRHARRTATPSCSRWPVGTATPSSPGRTGTTSPVVTPTSAVYAKNAQLPLLSGRMSWDVSSRRRPERRAAGQQRGRHPDRERHTRERSAGRAAGSLAGCSAGSSPRSRAPTPPWPRSRSRTPQRTPTGRTGMYVTNIPVELKNLPFGIDEGSSPGRRLT